MKDKEKKINKTKERGITLVVLVVTIIVLLILVGVTLNLALSDNGLFDKSREVVEKYKVAEEDEEDKLSQLGNKLGNIVIRPNTIKEAKESGYEFEKNTPLPDGKGNKVVIPGKFHIAKDSGDTVQEGVVIEDSNGNQFVWIPVSNVDGDNNANTTENQNDGDLIKVDDNKKVEITLGRYTFKREGNDSEGYKDGTPELKQAGVNYNQEITIDSYFIEQSEHTNGGVGAKNLEEFVESVKKNHGYYLARYEASFASGSSPSKSYGSNGEGEISIMENQKPKVRVSTSYSTSSMNYTEGTLWNFLTQEDASKLSQNMYKSGENEEANFVESDLVNSYAWDTAIVYIQAMGNTNYANHGRGSNDSLKNTGDTGDEKCKIFDIAGNICEWTTEYSINTSDTGKKPCVVRGSNYDFINGYAAVRDDNFTADSNRYFGFRPILYLK